MIEVRSSLNQIDNLLTEIHARINAKERVLVTTLTKRMAEELANYLTRFDIKCRYIHSDIDTLDRVEIMEGLRKGEFDVLVGINLFAKALIYPKFHWLPSWMLTKKASFVLSVHLHRLQGGLPDISMER